MTALRRISLREKASLVGMILIDLIYRCIWRVE